MQTDDARLVAQVRAGDKAAFGPLVTRHEVTARRLAGRLLGDSAEAEDVFQEACLQAYLDLERLRAPERFGSWLCGIVVNLSRMRLRGRRVVYTLEDWDGGRVDAGFTWAEREPSPEAAYEARELHQRILSALERLPPAQREAVRLHYYDGLTVGEVAILAGAPAGTIKARLSRARDRLQAILMMEWEQHPRQQEKEAISMIPVEILDVVSRRPKSAQELAGSLPNAWPRTPAEAPAERFIVLLKATELDRALPIWIGWWEACQIAAHMAGQEMRRPLTFDLMAQLLDSSGGQVESVAVSRLHETVFYATIRLRAAGGKIVEIDARPSDALALAQRAGAPIFVAEDVLAAEGSEAVDLPISLNSLGPAMANEGEVEWLSMPETLRAGGKPA